MGIGAYGKIVVARCRECKRPFYQDENVLFGPKMSVALKVLSHWIKDHL